MVPDFKIRPGPYNLYPILINSGAFLRRLIAFFIQTVFLSHEMTHEPSSIFTKQKPKQSVTELYRVLQSLAVPYLLFWALRTTFSADLSRRS